MNTWRFSKKYIYILIKDFEDDIRINLKSPYWCVTISVRKFLKKNYKKKDLYNIKLE